MKDQGVVAELELITVPRQVNEIIGIAPGQAVTTRSVMVPGRRKVNIEAALPYALEDTLGEDVEELHFTLLQWQSGGPATTAIVAKADLRRWQNNCRQAGINLDRILPGYLMLPLHGKGSMSISILDDGNIYVRTGEFTGFAADMDFFEFWLESKDLEGVAISVTDVALARSLTASHNANISHWDIGNQIGDWLPLEKLTLKEDSLSLLHGEFMPPHRSRNYRPIKIAVFCGLVAAVTFYAAMIWETHSLRSQEEVIDRKIVKLFKQHFPQEPYLGRPGFQVESLLQNRSGPTQNHEFQRLLRSITRVTRQHRAEIEEVNYRNQAIMVTCNVGSLSVLDDIRQSLQKISGVTAELLSSGARDNKVTGRFRISGTGT